MDNNLLEGVKRWLEPLPDRSLPALNVQKELFGVLETMTIDTISLKMSGLGRVVVFYTLCKRVEPSIRRTAEHLVEVWTRPILKRSASYRDRQVAPAEWHQNSPVNPSNHLHESAFVANKNRRHVGIPQSVTTGFQVAPRNRVAGSTNDHEHQTRLANYQRYVRQRRHAGASFKTDYIFGQIEPLQVAVERRETLEHPLRNSWLKCKFAHTLASLSLSLSPLLAPLVGLLINSTAREYMNLTESGKERI